MRPANPCSTRPANPCQPKRKPEEPPVPPSVGRDKVDQMLRDRRRDGDVMPPANPCSMQQPTPRAAPTDDDAIRRLGERLRQQKPASPAEPLVGSVPAAGREPG